MFHVIFIVYFQILDRTSFHVSLPVMSNIAKKAWSKSSKKEKVYQNTLFIEQKDYDAAITTVSTMKICTNNIVADRLKIGVSVAKKVIAAAVQKGFLVPVYTNGQIRVYTTTIKKEEKVEEKVTKKAAK